MSPDRVPSCFDHGLVASPPPTQSYARSPRASEVGAESRSRLGQEGGAADGMRLSSFGEEAAAGAAAEWRQVQCRRTDGSRRAGNGSPSFSLRLVDSKPVGPDGVV